MVPCFSIMLRFSFQTVIFAAHASALELIKLVLAYQIKHLKTSSNVCSSFFGLQKIICIVVA